MAKQKWLGWALVLLALILLARTGKLGLVAVLIPISLLLGYAAVHGRKSTVTQAPKKG